MVDLSEKVSDSEEMSSKNQEGGASSEEGQVKKTCADCGTSKTPLWRGGPAGPKSLCNACGIKSRKMRRAILGINKSDDHHNKKQQPKKRATTTTTTTTNQRSLDQKRLLSIGKDVLMSRSRMEKQWRKLGEDEQAAVLLMALSYGSIYA